MDGFERALTDLGAKRKRGEIDAKEYRRAVQALIEQCPCEVCGRKDHNAERHERA